MDIETGARPEGATHWSPAVRDESRLEAYWRPDGKGGYDCWAVSELGGFWQKNHAPLPLYAIEISKPWTGEGLPPVGTVCELRTHKLNEWGRAVIKFASRNVVVWDWEGEPEISGLCTRYAHEVEMRAIRTPEQIAAVAKEKAIDVIEKRIMDRMGDLNARDLAEDLFDLLGEMSKPTDQ